jgi:hypothetical protein
MAVVPSIKVSSDLLSQTTLFSSSFSWHTDVVVHRFIHGQASLPSDVWNCWKVSLRSFSVVATQWLWCCDVAAVRRELLPEFGVLARGLRRRRGVADKRVVPAPGRHRMSTP